ncbi:Lipoate-protein ligase A-like protein [Polymorphum gilvum SL003B-26A1]|uniref:Lipoate-protein ligase A-like protein n=1 Tax=Polymorphum gilvum (strain LMG 25793 / CGMCC 1.9160 / SL003B-26A1) TaxID=991905 RepID=F2J2H2_POLGS|nr:Lipoate-protein ligase A-like protein [Polymorphum gilvum SL003B-26A1]
METTARRLHRPEVGAVPAPILVETEPLDARRRFDDLSVLSETVAQGSQSPCVVLWRTAQALSVTRSEARLPAFAEALERLDLAGWPIVVRRGGGSAFPIGPGTLQVSLLTRKGVPDVDFDRLYDRLAGLVRQGLANLGMPSRVGEIANAFCRGRYDISVDGRKVAGLSQAWGGKGAVVAEASILIAADVRGGAEAVNRFHALAGSDLRCDPQASASLVQLAGIAAETAVDALLAAAKPIAEDWAADLALPNR